jgi:uncharacterized ferritin-like protein (DUF455 family)
LINCHDENLFNPVFYLTIETVAEAREAALEALQITDPSNKVAAVSRLAGLPLDPLVPLSEPANLPGRPVRPGLVAPRDVPKRPITTTEGHGALIHALAHIELNAVNLSLDACWRFPGMPEQYYRDWLKVAVEEAYHRPLLLKNRQSFQ